MNQAFIVGGATTAFGSLPTRGALDLMAEAGLQAIADAGLEPHDIDGVLCGYATTLPHLMLSTVFCERVGIRPHWAHGMALGGATGAAMLMLARDLVRVGRCRNVLVVAGENRLTGQSRDLSIQTLAQVGDPDYEVPNGASVPTYYALLASEYMAATGLTSEDLAELSVLMRSHAARHPQAHSREPITVADVLRSKPISEPLRLLDCCPISDGAVGLVVSDRKREGGPSVAIVGAGQAHLHQHLTNLQDVLDCGARRAADRAFEEAGLQRCDIDYLAMYDSFTITLAMMLEETGFAPRGRVAEGVRAGRHSIRGDLPMNTHGGLLSFGHSGVAGGMAHAVEAFRQLTGQAGDRQAGTRKRAYFHADGGVMSSHVGMIFEAA